MLRYDQWAGRSLRRFRRNIFVLRGVMILGELVLNIISGAKATFFNLRFFHSNNTAARAVSKLFVGKERLYTINFRLVQRSVSSLDPTSSAFPRMDWRFSEFPNCGAHALYVTCVELMTVPEQPAVIGEKLLEVAA